MSLQTKRGFFRRVLKIAFDKNASLLNFFMVKVLKLLLQHYVFEANFQGF